MKIAPFFGLTVLVGVAGQASAADVYTDSASFLANTEAGISFNGFDDVGAGFSPDLSYSLNGFAYDISTGDDNLGLVNDPGVISTNSSEDSILVTFTSGNVTAVGGNFWAGDFFFGPVDATIVITLSDGTVVDFVATGSSDFRGFTSDLIITSIQIGATNTPSGNAWPIMDNLYVGVAVVPLPPAAWAGLGMLGVMGGVRAVRRRG